MRHGLAAVAAVVDHDAITGFGDAEFPGQSGGGQQQVAEGGLVGGGRFTDAGNELLRDDEHMHRRLRIDVVDGEAELVLVRELRRNLAVDDLLENRFHCLQVEGSAPAELRSSWSWTLQLKKQQIQIRVAARAGGGKFADEV